LRESLIPKASEVKVKITMKERVIHWSILNTKTKRREKAVIKKTIDFMGSYLNTLTLKTKSHVSGV
jgi:hypothetical protein